MLGPQISVFQICKKNYIYRDFQAKLVVYSFGGKGYVRKRAENKKK